MFSVKLICSYIIVQRESILIIALSFTSCLSSRVLCFGLHRRTYLMIICLYFKKGLVLLLSLSARLYRPWASQRTHKQGDGASRPTAIRYLNLVKSHSESTSLKQGTNRYCDIIIPGLRRFSCNISQNWFRQVIVRFLFCLFQDDPLSLRQQCN